jgi:hypothetical protein
MLPSGRLPCRDQNALYQAILVPVNVKLGASLLGQPDPVSSALGTARCSASSCAVRSQDRA